MLLAFLLWPYFPGAGTQRHGRLANAMTVLLHVYTPSAFRLLGRQFKKGMLAIHFSSSNMVVSLNKLTPI